MQSAAARFDPAFIERSPLFWPITPAARRVLHAPSVRVAGTDAAALAATGAFPQVESFDRVFGGAAGGASDSSESVASSEPPVRFVAAAPRPRRRGRRTDRVDPRALYDARITLDRLVPSRQDSWHDLMNALVWGTFPRAKSALHARQHRAITARIEPGARTLPSSRTRELDALALLDEGGVLLPVGNGARDSRELPPIVFGHAIYESLALGIPPAVVAAIELALPATWTTPSAVLVALDEALARAIDDTSRLRTPGELRRVDLSAHA
jgi:hypothetical protein